MAFTQATTGCTLTDTHNGLRAFDRAVAELLDIRLPGMAHASEILDIVATARAPGTRRCPSYVVYTDYSRAKGQSCVNALNIPVRPAPRPCPVGPR